MLTLTFHNLNDLTTKTEYIRRMYIRHHDEMAQLLNTLQISYTQSLLGIKIDAMNVGEEQTERIQALRHDQQEEMEKLLERLKIPIANVQTL